MTISKNSKLPISQSDREKLLYYINSIEAKQNDSETWKGEMSEKLKSANIISDSSFSRDVSRLFSTVIIRDTIARINFEYKLLPPDEAESNSYGISVLSPFGFALLGRKEGSSFTWQFNKKKKHFLIIEVRNSFSEGHAK